jgi:hypothetical protein
MPSLKTKTWLSLNVLPLTSLLLWLTLSAKAQDCSDQATAHPAFKWTGTEPLVLLTEYNPWAMAIASDTPTFALYADGTVICRDDLLGVFDRAHMEACVPRPRISSVSARSAIAPWRA